jgi:hypothetical protein
MAARRVQKALQGGALLALPVHPFFHLAVVFVQNTSAVEACCKVHSAMLCMPHGEHEKHLETGWWVAGRSATASGATAHVQICATLLQ